MQGPPFGLWLIGLQMIVVSVVLTVPRIALLPTFVPSSIAWSDVFDGLIGPLLAAMLYQRLFDATAARFSLGPLLLVALRSVGAGAHSVANSSDILNDHNLRTLLGRHLFCCHESFAHYAFYVAEYGLLAMYLHRILPMPQLQKGPLYEVDQGVELPSLLIASLHGLASGILAVGTRTAPTLIIVWVTVTVLLRSRKRSSDAMKYALVWSVCSLLFVAAWFLMHNFALPTFGDVNGEYKT